jgi:hypothetical protein
VDKNGIIITSLTRNLKYFTWNVRSNRLQPITWRLCMAVKFVPFLQQFFVVCAVQSKLKILFLYGLGQKRSAKRIIQEYDGNHISNFTLACRQLKKFKIITHQLKFIKNYVSVLQRIVLGIRDPAASRVQFSSADLQCAVRIPGRGTAP